MLRAVLWTGGNAPSRDAALTVTGDGRRGFWAYWGPGYCPCEDCRGHIIIGWGRTEAEAVENYWEQWEEL